MNEPNNNIIWTRASGDASASVEPVLIGRKISGEWLKNDIPLLGVRFSGDLFRALSDMLEAAKSARKKLPITSLRVALTGGLDNTVSLDRDLGLKPGIGGASFAITMFDSDDEDRDAIRQRIADYVKYWVMDTLEIWAERNGIGKIVERLKNSVLASNIELSETPSPLLPKGRPDFALIARCIGGKLIGEDLFEGFSSCELIASPESRSNSIELMTLPQQAILGDSVFSMVARLTVCSVPNTKDVFLGISAMKRVWAKKTPVATAKMPRRVTGYVMSKGRPALTVPVRRSDGQWAFGDGYSATLRESDGALPPTLDDAIKQRGFNEQTGWWAGLPSCLRSSSMYLRAQYLRQMKCR